MIEHPPIPPNCDYFRRIDCFGMSFCFRVGNSDYIWPFEGAEFDFPAMRTIISSVARCAWMDIALSVENKIRDANDGSDEFGWDDASRSNFGQAHENSELWRIFGNMV